MGSEHYNRRMDEALWKISPELLRPLFKLLGYRLDGIDEQRTTQDYHAD